jgi:hypothetical protein
MGSRNATARSLLTYPLIELISGVGKFFSGNSQYMEYERNIEKRQHSLSNLNGKTMPI